MLMGDYTQNSIVSVMAILRQLRATVGSKRGFIALVTLFDILLDHFDLLLLVLNFPLNISCRFSKFSIVCDP